MTEKAETLDLLSDEPTSPSWRKGLVDDSAALLNAVRLRKSTCQQILSAAANVNESQLVDRD